MAHVEDRWMTPGPNGKKVKSARHGKGQRWLAHWHEGGQRKAKAFATQDAAKAHLAQVDVDQRAGTHVLSTKMTVAEYGDHWVTTQIHQRESTGQQMESRWRLHIRPALGPYLLSEVTRGHVQAAVIGWSESLAPATVGVVYGYLASLMKTAAADRLIRESPCQRIKMPNAEHERVVPLRVRQVQTIAQQISPRFRGMVWLAAGTGMRSGELRGLTVDRLFPGADGLRIRVDRQLVSSAPKWGPPKTRRGDRWISVDEDTERALVSHMQAFPPREDGLIFYGRTGVPLARNSMQAAWQIGVRGIPVADRSGWHALRHFHASMLIAAGMSVTAVAERLGHTPAECLETYAHLWPNDDDRMRKAVSAALWSEFSQVVDSPIGELA